LSQHRPRRWPVAAVSAAAIGGLRRLAVRGGIDLTQAVGADRPPVISVNGCSRAPRSRTGVASVYREGIIALMRPVKVIEPLARPIG